MRKVTAILRICSISPQNPLFPRDLRRENPAYGTDSESNTDVLGDGDAAGCARHQFRIANSC
jgi:hypothetical protein